MSARVIVAPIVQVISRWKDQPQYLPVLGISITEYKTRTKGIRSSSPLPRFFSYTRWDRFVVQPVGSRTLHHPSHALGSSMSSSTQLHLQVPSCRGQPRLHTEVSGCRRDGSHPGWTTQSQLRELGTESFFTVHVGLEASWDYP